MRDDDREKKTFFRSDRFFSEGDKWFFTTREGAIKGPYDSRADAEQELMLFLRDLRNMESFGLDKKREQ